MALIRLKSYKKLFEFYFFQKSGFELITTVSMCVYLVRQSWMGEPYGPPKMRVFFILCVIFDGSDNKTEDSKCF